MLLIAWRNLVREKTRLVISVFGVAVAVVLILLLRGVYTGITRQATEYIRSVDADVWVAQSGAPGDFYHSVSLLPTTLDSQLESVRGVRSVDAFTSRQVSFQASGTERELLLIGIDPAHAVAGPPDIVEGIAVSQEGDIVVDRVFADNAMLGIGDQLDIQGRELRVVGIASGGNTILRQFAWADIGDVQALLGTPEVVNYFLVRGTAGTSPAEIAARIQRSVPDVKTFTSEEFAAKNSAALEETFLPIVLVLVLIGVVVGITVIGLTTYTAALEKRREYGVLKAIGLSKVRLAGIVVQQALVAAMIGFLVGAAVALAAGELIERAVPSFVTEISAGDVAAVGVTAVVMGLLASLVPLRPVNRLDPAEVFRV